MSDVHYLAIVPCAVAHACGCRPVGTPPPVFTITTTQEQPPEVCKGSGWPIVTGMSATTTALPCGICKALLTPDANGNAPTHAYAPKGARE